MLEQFRLIFGLYRRPTNAASQIIDQGSPWFGIGAALLVLAGVQYAVSAVSGVPLGALFGAKVLVLIALGFAPAAILVITLHRAHEGFAVTFQRDFLPLLNCLSLALAAAFLPVAIIGPLWPAALPILPLAILGGLAFLYFLFLTVCCLRTLGGTSFGMATGASFAGWAGFIGVTVISALGGGLVFRYLASPFLLFFAWRYFASDVRSFGEGFRSRQHFRQQLEIATNNPRDADAHYQLGLIYQQRRQFTEARKRFERAVEIDAHEAEPAFHLGRISLEENKPDEAVTWLRKAAASDDKCAGNEVWRELAVALLKVSQGEEALAAITKYVDRRPYDPEGLYWQGKILAALHRPDQAIQSFQACIEAVITMPSHRRRQVHKWKRMASNELDSIKNIPA